MEFNLIPFEGTDKIKFGMTSEEIQSILKIKPTLLNKTEFQLYNTEEYKDICCIYYDLAENGTLICAEIEFIKSTKVFLDNVQLLGKSRKKVVELFKQKFEDFIDDGDDLIGSDHYEIHFLAPKHRHNNSKVVSLSIAIKGRYLQVQERFNKVIDEKYNPDSHYMREYICLNCNNIIISDKLMNKCDKCNVFMIPK